MSSSLFEAYVSGSARHFYGSWFADPADRRRAVQRAVRPLHPSVADVLDTQNARYVPSPARVHNLSRLRQGAAAVVTGQQAGLFLGPLMNLHKAASAIRLARVLASESGAPVVPVFWMQSEDHDLAEIAETHLPRANGATLNLRCPVAPDHRVSVAHCRLPPEVVGCLDQLHQEVAALPHGEEMFRLLERHYRDGASWADAFAGALAELFAAEGLVVIHPRDPALAPLAAPLHRRALDDAASIAATLAARSAELRAAGYAIPVHVRDGAPLSFVHPEGAAGPRFRLAPTSDRHVFAEVGGPASHTIAELHDWVETEPLRFSTSVLLRPLWQDTLLPTAAYVGGPAEVAYFAQVVTLYPHFDLAPSLVVPRARLRILEPKTLRLLARCGLTPEDTELSEDEMSTRARAARTPTIPVEIESELLEPFDRALASLKSRLDLDADGMAVAVTKTRATVADAVAKLASRYRRRELHADGDLVHDVHRLRRLLQPGGVPQERFFGLPYFAARYGVRPFVERLIAAIDPLDPRWHDVAVHDTPPTVSESEATT